jgi:hypothetical protein
VLREMVVQEHAMRKFSSVVSVWVGAVVCAVGSAAAQPGLVGRVGAMGDSLTDEYAEETYDYAKNWAMLVVEGRGVRMGPTAEEAGRPGGTWGEPRRTGFEANWARYGADSASALAEGQHTGLAGMVGTAGGGGGGGEGGVTHAVVAIGANDFAPTSDAYFNIYFGLWSSSRITTYVNQRVANIRAAVETLRAAGAEVVLCNVVDFGIVPAARQFYTNAGNRQRVANAIARVNLGVAALAEEKGTVLVDTAGLATALLGTHANLRQTLVIGGVGVGVTRRDTAGNTDPLAGFVDDGAHPHTTIQGVFANLMLTAMNVGWEAGYARLTEREILEAAGLGYGGAETLGAVIGTYEQYVRSFVCRADFNDDGFLDFFDYDDYVAAFEAGDPRAEFNGDGFVDFFDYDEFVGSYEAGC